MAKMTKSEEFFLSEYMAAAMYELVYKDKPVEYGGCEEDPANWYEWAWFYDRIHNLNRPRKEREKIWHRQ